MKNNLSERYLTAAIVFGGMIGTYFFTRPRKKLIQTSLDNKRQQKADQNLLTPKNETFGLAWSVIYLGTAALTVHQLLPEQAENPRYEKAQPWLRVNYLLTGLFGFFFSKSSKEHRIGAALTTLAMLPASLGLHRALEIGETTVTAPENMLQKSISLYAGWLTAAAAVSGTSLIQEAGYLRDTDEAKHWAAGLLPVTTGLGLLISNKLNDPVYLISIVTALTGIALKQKDEHKEISILASTLATYLLTKVADKLKTQLQEA